MFKLRLFRKTFLFVTSFYLVSCATIESTFDSTVESISEAGDYIYNTVNFFPPECVKILTFSSRMRQKSKSLHNKKTYEDDV